ncbi:MAG: aminodeoxychorismate lyase [Piscirickettsiaceae bacterium]|nr:aminodeoxychorismate lyase [Piscirickettsiaceae bacterium]
MILINGIAEDRINISDRGLQYGDGLFETIVYRNGVLEFLDAHLERLITDCKRLKIPFQDSDDLRADLLTVCQSLRAEAVIKVIITRGSGGRGYFAGSDINPSRIVSSHPLPNYPDSYYQQGVSIRFCQHPISENTVLAGIKHLNRLDQVLARNEWHDTNIVEGLLFNNDGDVIEGTMSNVFIVKSGQLITAKLDKSGVAGIMRAQVSELANVLALPVNEATISQQELLNADEVFICNSVMGILPVSQIVDINKIYAVGTITQQLQNALQKLGK